MIDSLAWRQRAVELRAVAESTQAADCREVLLMLAADSEDIAAELEKAALPGLAPDAEQAPLRG
jgi:hypothetical protein